MIEKSAKSDQILELVNELISNMVPDMEEYGLDCTTSTMELYDTLSKLNDEDGWKSNFEFYIWENDSLVSKLSELVNKNPKEFNDEATQMLYDLLKEGHVFGHSFAKYNEIFIDPHLKSNGASQSAIKEMDTYLIELFQQLGITHKKL